MLIMNSAGIKESNFNIEALLIYFFMKNSFLALNYDYYSIVSDKAQEDTIACYLSKSRKSMKKTCTFIYFMIKSN